MALQLNYHPPPRRRPPSVWFWCVIAAIIVVAAVVWLYFWVGMQGLPTPGTEHLNRSSP
jgi:hypothetical protein